MQRPEKPDRSHARGLRVPLIALASALLVFLVALGASRSLAHVGGPGDLDRGREIAGALIVLVVGFSALPVSIYVLWLIWREVKKSDYPQGHLPSTGKRLATQLLGFAALFVAIIAIALAFRGEGSPPPAETTEGPAPTRPAPKPTGSEQTARDLAPWVLAGVAGAYLVILAAALARRRRTGSSLADFGEEDVLEDEPELHQELREVIDDSLEAIAREPDPRRAVVRAYTGMEQAFARHSLGRRRFEAPFEYLARALAAAHLSHRAAEGLTRLFERAQFSQHAIDVGMKSDAISALGEVREELEAALGEAAAREAGPQ